MSTLSDSCPTQSRVLLCWGFMVALLVGSVLSILTPPLKSPDEGDHVRRAYLFSQGDWLLKSLPCAGEPVAEEAAEDASLQVEPDACKDGRSMSGGKVDIGLEAYLATLYPHDGLERSETELSRAHARQFHWEGRQRFVYAPGTGYYLPLIYAPQALGLTLGRVLNLSIDGSYYLARFITLLATLSVLWLACRVHALPASVAGILLLPSSLFQSVALSIDGLSMAWAVLAATCLLRFVQSRDKTSSVLFALMAFSVFVVGGSRAHLASMVLMLFCAAWLHRSRIGWAMAIGTTVAVCAWYAVAIPSTLDLRIQRAYTTGDTLAYYLAVPSVLLEVLGRTLADSARQVAYLSSFVGEFFNLRLENHPVQLLLTLLGALVAASLAPLAAWRRQALARGTLLLTAVSATLLAFLAMLLTWTPHPATVVEGVQGRYFLIPAMLLLMAFSAWQPVHPWRRRLLTVLLFALFSASILITVARMLHGFYLPWRAIDGHELPTLQPTGEMRQGPRLSPGQSVPLLLPSVADMGDQVGPLQAIGVMLKIPSQHPSGHARLTLHSDSGLVQLDTSLVKARDNGYFYFLVPPARYLSAEIAPLDKASGFGVWSFSAGEEGAAETPCVILVYAHSQRLTPGCPAPEYR